MASQENALLELFGMVFVGFAVVFCVVDLLGAWAQVAIVFWPLSAIVAAAFVARWLMARRTRKRPAR